MFAKPKALMTYMFAVATVVASLGAMFLAEAFRLLMLRRLMSYMRLKNAELYVGTKAVVARSRTFLKVLTPVLVVLCLYMVLLISVRFNTPDPVVTTFPTGCPMGTSDPGCNRIALTNPSAALFNCVHCFSFSLYIVWVTLEKYSC